MRGKTVIVIMLMLLLPTILNKPILAIDPGHPPVQPSPSVQRIVYDIKVAFEDNGNHHPVAYWVNKDLNYTWTVDRTEYIFHMNRTQPDLLMDKQKLDNYSVYFQDGVQAPLKMVERYGDDNSSHTDLRLDYGLNHSFGHGHELITFNTHQMIVNLRDFIENKHHGYVGHCAGACFATPNLDKPTTFVEGGMSKSKFLMDNRVRAIYYAGWPSLDEHHFYIDNHSILSFLLLPYKHKPEDIAQAAAMMYSPQNRDNENAFINCVPIDTVILDHSNPIFKDYLSDTWRVHWGSGFGFYVPTDDPYVDRVVKYPSPVLDDANSYLAWSHPYPLQRILLHVYRPDQIMADPILQSRALELLFNQYFIDGDYDKIGSIMSNSEVDPADWGHLIKTHQIGSWVLYNLTYRGWVKHEPFQQTKPADPHLNDNFSTITLTYPENDPINGGRMVLSGVHPELPDWLTVDSLIPTRLKFSTVYI